MSFSPRKDLCRCGAVKGREANHCVQCARERRRLTPEQKLANAIVGFWKLVGEEDENGCWPWRGAIGAHGYGTSPNNVLGAAYAHRVSYQLTRGPIAEGLTIDHLCRNRACVNPEHLEPVTRGENTRRGMMGRLRTHCKHGHEYTEANTGRTTLGTRYCRECHRDRQYERYHTFLSARAQGRKGYRRREQ